MLLFLIFVVVPVIEIALFIQVGGLLGLAPTLAIVVGTAALGSWLLRQQGRAALSRLQQSFGQLSDPSQPLADGAMILFAGALLLTPGFFTDALGFALMAPPVRAFVFNQLKSRIKVHSATTFHTQQNTYRPDASPDVIDGDYHDVTTDRGDRGPSKWTEH